MTYTPSKCCNVKDPNVCCGWDCNFVVEDCFALNCTLRSFELFPKWKRRTESLNIFDVNSQVTWDTKLVTCTDNTTQLEILSLGSGRKIWNFFSLQIVLSGWAEGFILFKDNFVSFGSIIIAAWENKKFTFSMKFESTLFWSTVEKMYFYQEF